MSPKEGRWGDRMPSRIFFGGSYTPRIWIPTVTVECPSCGFREKHMNWTVTEAREEGLGKCPKCGAKTRLTKGREPT